jgi:hypothetical protein
VFGDILGAVHYTYLRLSIQQFVGNGHVIVADKTVDVQLTQHLLVLGKDRPSYLLKNGICCIHCLRQVALETWEISSRGIFGVLDSQMTPPKNRAHEDQVIQSHQGSRMMRLFPCLVNL